VILKKHHVYPEEGHLKKKKSPRGRLAATCGAASSESGTQRLGKIGAVDVE
jgi:hypothetical protein